MRKKTWLQGNLTSLSITRWVIHSLSYISLKPCQYKKLPDVKTYPMKWLCNDVIMSNIWRSQNRNTCKTITKNNHRGQRIRKMSIISAHWKLQLKFTYNTSFYMIIIQPRWPAKRHNTHNRLNKRFIYLIVTRPSCHHCFSIVTMEKQWWQLGRVTIR